MQCRVGHLKMGLNHSGCQGYDKLDYPNPFFSWSNANGNKKVTVLKGDKHCWSPKMELPAQWL